MLQILPSPPPPTSHRCLCLMQNPICHLAHDWMNWNAFQTNCQKFQKIRPNLAQGQFQGKYRIQKIQKIQNAEHPASSILCSMQPLTLFQEVLVCAEIDASLACFRIGSPQPFYTRPHTAIPFKSSFLSHFQWLGMITFSIIFWMHFYYMYIVHFTTTTARMMEREMSMIWCSIPATDYMGRCMHAMTDLISQKIAPLAEPPCIIVSTFWISKSLQMRCRLSLWEQISLTKQEQTLLSNQIRIRSPEAEGSWQPLWEEGSRRRESWWRPKQRAPASRTPPDSRFLRRRSRWSRRAWPGSLPWRSGSGGFAASAPSSPPCCSGVLLLMLEMEVLGLLPGTQLASWSLGRGWKEPDGHTLDTFGSDHW